MKGGRHTRTIPIQPLLIVLMNCTFLPLPSFADDSQAVDQASMDQFYAEQEQKLNLAASQLETAHQAGHISDAEYEEAKKGLDETREFVRTQGKNLGPQMAAVQEAAAPIMAAHNACQDLQEDPQGYQACVQSKLQ